MSIIIRDLTTLHQLHQVQEGAELCDESGRTLGYFTPVVDPSEYEGAEAPVNEEQLQRREQQLTGRTLSEILADLEKQG